MTAAQMLDILKEYGIESKEQFFREFEKLPGLDIGCMTQKVQHQETGTA